MNGTGALDYIEFDMGNVIMKKILLLFTCTFVFILINSTSIFASDEYPAFYGIWCAASKDRNEAESYANILKSNGYDGRVMVSSEWSNLNPEFWYVVTGGVYATQLEAERIQTAIQGLYPDAYIKYSGEWMYTDHPQSESSLPYNAAQNIQNDTEKEERKSDKELIFDRINGIWNINGGSSSDNWTKGYQISTGEMNVIDLASGSIINKLDIAMFAISQDFSKVVLLIKTDKGYYGRFIFPIVDGKATEGYNSSYSGNDPYGDLWKEDAALWSYSGESSINRSHSANSNSHIVEEQEDFHMSDLMYGTNSGAFWGIWCGASKDSIEMCNMAMNLRSYGYDGRVTETTDWSNLNTEHWFVVTAGTYKSEDAAYAQLAGVQAYYPDAYVKYSGEAKY